MFRSHSRQNGQFYIARGKKNLMLIITKESSFQYNEELMVPQKDFLMKLETRGNTNTCRGGKGAVQTWKRKKKKGSSWREKEEGNFLTKQKNKGGGGKKKIRALMP